MVLHGTIKNGTVVFDEKVQLPDGQRVMVEIAPAGQQSLSTTQKLLELAGVVKDGPPDASRNHDHYIYGTPKREPEE